MVNQWSGKSHRDFSFRFDIYVEILSAQKRLVSYEFTSGNLEKWFTREKIFLLNSSLSVVDGKPGSHMKLWENFTDRVSEFISINNKNCIFLLLGNFAKKKEQFIVNKSKIIKGVHPMRQVESPSVKIMSGECFDINVESQWIIHSELSAATHPNS